MVDTTRPLLIELGTEELPPKALRTLSAAFTNDFASTLKEAGVVEQDAIPKGYAAPRRLAILIDAVAASQPTQTVERRGPAVQAAFKDGEPTPAALGFARSCGVKVDQLDRLTTDKGEWLSFSVEETGASITELAQQALDQAIKRLPIPKRMRWGDYDAEFVRPAKWLVALYGDEVLPLNCLNLTAGRTSRGHRFHSDQLIEHTTANDYASRMQTDGKVVVDFMERQELIQTQINALAASVNGQLPDDAALLDEVTGLVEWPRAVLGRFDDAFLSIPAECLISSMRDHQKYFHLTDDKSQLLPYFITVSNIESHDEPRMVSGNERVLRARLSDADFFWQTDLSVPLSTMGERLNNVLFHVKLGTIGQKTERLMQLSVQLAERLNADPSVTQRAAQLCKADLVSGMVGEFDELQGIMGHYYAKQQGEPQLVGEAIEQHYWPKFAGDQLPQSAEAQSLAIADKLDSLVGIYAAGEIPTGDKDPYALRRAALSILRIIIEHQHDLSLNDLVALSADAYRAEQGFSIADDTLDSIQSFIEGRIPAYYQSQDIPATHIQAVAVCHPENPLDFEQRLKGVSAFSQLPEANDLAAANKRISNILKKQSLAQEASVNESMLVEEAEKNLFKAIEAVSAKCQALFDNGLYGDGLHLLASLREPIDTFFDQVMVMAEEVALQNNRLALLKRVQDCFLQVADVSHLQS